MRSGGVSYVQNVTPTGLSLFAFVVFKDLVVMPMYTLPQGHLMRYMTPAVGQEIMPRILYCFPVTGWKKEMHLVVCWHCVHRPQLGWFGVEAI